MSNSSNSPIWVITDNTSGLYFSMLGSNHFTDNMEIAQRFSSEADAILCEEEHIHSMEEFEDCETWPVILSSSFLDVIIDPSQYGYDAMEEIISGSGNIEDVEASIQSMIDSLRKAQDNITSLKIDGETRLG